jgi:hypothetical protein
MENMFDAFIDKFCIIAKGEEVRPGVRDVDKEALKAARDVLITDFD